MKLCFDWRVRSRNRRTAFTLVEVMIATAITLLLMALVVQVFAVVGNAASDTRAVLQVIDRVRSVQSTLQTDLANVTAPMLPPLRPEVGSGYFEYVEGMQGPATPASAVSYNINEGFNFDQTIGDPDDVLMFTTRSEHNLFYGRTRYLVTTMFGGAVQRTAMDGTLTSQTAEVCYFVRGSTLYRRVLLVAPTAGLTEAFENGGSIIDPAIFLSSNYIPSNITANQNTANYNISFYDKFDLSVHQEGGTYDVRKYGTRPVLVANSLADLTRRENRYGHQPWQYPYDTRFWGTPVNPAMAAGPTNPGISLGLPTLRECTFYTDLLSATNPPVARWPFPFFDPNPTGFVWAGTSNLWGSALPGGAPLPFIFPSPTGPLATYQTANQHVTTIPSAGTPHLNVTLNALALNPAPNPFDAWVNPFPWDQIDQESGTIYAFSGANQPNAASGSYDGSTRVAEDVILTNVISFDVKAWDATAPIISDNLVDASNPSNPVPPGSEVFMPGDVGYAQLMATWATNAGGNPATFLSTVKAHTVGLGAYVDLNYLQSVSSSYSATDPPPNMYQAITKLSAFSGPGIGANINGLASLYDTGSFSYENDGLDQDGLYGPDQLTNGFDDNGIGGVDDLSEFEGSVPYPVPLKGIQVKIRVFEPDSRQIREVTVTEDFLWE